MNYIHSNVQLTILKRDHKPEEKTTKSWKQFRFRCLYPYWFLRITTPYFGWWEKSCSSSFSSHQWYQCSRAIHCEWNCREYSQNMPQMPEGNVNELMATLNINWIIITCFCFCFFYFATLNSRLYWEKTPWIFLVSMLKGGYMNMLLQRLNIPIGGAWTHSDHLFVDSSRTVLEHHKLQFISMLIAKLLEYLRSFHSYVLIDAQLY